MNKLLAYRGGQPVFLDDLIFLQDTMQEGVKGILTAFENTILSGCEISLRMTFQGRETHWNDGYIVLNHEIYPVRSGSLPTDSDALFWCIESDHPVSGNRTFVDDNVIKPCHAFYYVTMKTEAGLTGISINQVKRFDQIIFDMIKFFVNEDIKTSVSTLSSSIDSKISTLSSNVNTKISALSVSVDTKLSTLKSEIARDYMKNIAYTRLPARSMESCKTYVYFGEAKGNNYLRISFHYDGDKVLSNPDNVFCTLAIPDGKDLEGWADKLVIPCIVQYFGMPSVSGRISFNEVGNMYAFSITDLQGNSVCLGPDYDFRIDLEYKLSAV